MKKIILPFILIANTAFALDQFPYIEPYSVEKAPVKKVVQKQEIQENNDSDDALLEELPEDTLPEDDLEALPQEDVILPPDEDKDGVEDSKDKCPHTSLDFQVDKFGCPKTATLHINFPPDEYKVTQNVLDKVTNFAEFLKKNKGYQVIIYGYTDSRGEAKDNQILSQKRADSVKEALIQLGISEPRLTAIGMGEKNPIADNTFKAGRQKNRRIEIELLK